MERSTDWTTERNPIHEALGSLLYNLRMRLTEVDYEELSSFDLHFKRSFKTVAGLDEAGRGPLAGPVVAAAVVIDKPIAGIYDSKALTERRREELYEEIVGSASVGIGLSTPEEIDLLNILNATKLAMNRALKALQYRPSFVLVDGKHLTLDIRGECIVGGDRLSMSIAAASIVAKVYRDGLMRDLAVLYPEYGYDHHKGYGTKKHLDAISLHGPSTWHRLTYRPIREMANPEIISGWLKHNLIAENRLFRAGLTGRHRSE